MSNLCKCLVAALWLVLAAGLFGSDSSARDLDRLIEQLGSSKFRQRERASQALQTIGARAVPALRKAAEAADAEVRRRAQLLLAALDPKDPGEEKARCIRRSQLPPSEKGWHLRALLKPGMTRVEVMRLLGGPGQVPPGRMALAGHWEEEYPDYALQVNYCQNQFKYTWQHTDW
jgi:hypothetical protein